MRNPLEQEWRTADLGDARLDRRLALVASRWAASPGASFPKMVHSDAELQGLYALLENDEVEPREIHAAHAREARGRIEEAALGCEVLIVADTTTFEFGGDAVREGLGWVSRSKQGFFAHIALALSADGSARPFGVVGVSTFMRDRPEPLAERGPRKHDGKKSVHDPERESLRWGALADETSAFLRGYAIPIHVSDRESDSYEYLSGRVKNDQRFVLRARELNRPVSSPETPDAAASKLRLVAERAVPVAEREVKLAARPRSPLPAARRKHPPRSERVARLEFAAERVRIERPKHLPEEMLAFVDVNLVHVRELEPPTDAQPVEWLLLTSQPIDTPEQILRVVDHYRARWTIEELNKAIKTGCQFESRQLEGRGLLIALAVCMPIAWQMLALRHQSRVTPEAPASTVLSPQLLAALRTIARKPLPQHPTVMDVFMAIAAVGGHIARNGPPGWKTLRDGLDHLFIVAAAFEARDAEEQRRWNGSDQS